MDESICEVVITADDEGWLHDFTRTLIRERLVACRQHVTPVRSIYLWQGAIEEGRETRVALHTRASLVPAVIERTRAEHPYDVPCVLALPITQVNPDYSEWVRTSTRDPN